MTVAQAIRRPKIFYGWFIVGLAFLAMTCGSLQFHVIGVFMKPLIAEFGWSRGAISGGQSVSTFVNGLLAPFIGGIIDRRGGKLIMLFGAAVYGAGLIALSLIGEIWHYYLAIGLLVAVGNLCMGGFVVNTTVSNWFVRKRGRAISITAMGVSFSGLILVPLTQFLVDNFGWRTAYIVLGAMIWSIMLLPIALIMRRRPEDVGLRPDGDPPSGVSEKSLSAVQRAAIKADVKWTRRQAMRTSTLWMLIAAFGLSTMGHLAMAMHLIPYVTDMGFSTVVAASAASLQSGTALVTKMFWGFLLERFQIRYMTCFSFACAAVAYVLLIGADSIEMVYLSQFFFGVALGGNIPNQEIVWANYFGRLSLGTIRSIGIPFMLIWSAGGPVATGVMFDLTNSYQTAFAALIGVYILSIAIMLLLRPPKHPQVRAIGTPS